MLSSLPRSGSEDAKPAGVACVTVVVVTRPTRRRLSRARAAMGVSRVPSGRTLMLPLRTREPLPHEDEAAAESVTSASSERMSNQPRVTSGRPASDHQVVPRPRTSR